MAKFQPEHAGFESLQGAVVVMGGASTGIGAATLKCLVDYKAKVVFGDTNASAASELCQTHPATFVNCDVSQYEQVFDLSKQAYDLYGRVDHAISAAGIFEQGDWFDPNFTIESVKEPGSTKGRGSLTFLSSVNAFRESPGLYQYQSSKHAIHGLLRAARKKLYERGTRVNAVLPGMTETPMTEKIIHAFKENDLCWQSASAVADIILVILTSQENGKAVYVEGGDGFEIEESIDSTQEYWLGEEATKRMRTNAEAVAKGALLPKS